MKVFGFCRFGAGARVALLFALGPGCTLQAIEDSGSQRPPDEEVPEFAECPYELSNVALEVQSFNLNWNSTLASHRDGRLFAWRSRGWKVVDDGGEPFHALAVATGHGGGESHRDCLIDADSQVWCWGKNQWGQLGDGTFEERDTPVQTLHEDGSPLLAKSISLRGSGLSCAVGLDDQVWCWGMTHPGVLRDNIPATLNPHPERLLTADGDALLASSISLGRSFTGCAVGLDEQLWCWGGTNGIGELGDNTQPTTDGVMTYYATAQKVLTADLSPFSGRQVSAGLDGACAISTDDTIWCWGVGLLPQGSYSTVAVQAVDSDGQPRLASQVSVRDYGGCFLDLEGAPHCWGHHDLDDPVDFATPRTTADGEIVLGAELVSSLNHTCMSDAEGGLWCWGKGCAMGDGGQSAGLYTTDLQEVLLPADAL